MYLRYFQQFDHHSKKIQISNFFSNLFNFIVIHFWIPTKKENKKIIVVSRGCQSVQKIAKNWSSNLKKTKIKIWQFY
jgi:GTPase Era involved in 16S rRNA processing